MRGDRELVAARIRGHMPAMVFVDLDLPRVPLFGDDLRIEDSDRVSSVDLRCITGLVVSVSGLNARRTRAFADACTEAGAMRVITFVSQPARAGQFEVIEVTDTEGVLTWQKK